MITLNQLVEYINRNKKSVLISTKNSENDENDLCFGRITLDKTPIEKIMIGFEYKKLNYVWFDVELKYSEIRNGGIVQNELMSLQSESSENKELLEKVLKMFSDRDVSVIQFYNQNNGVKQNGRNRRGFNLMYKISKDI